MIDSDYRHTFVLDNAPIPSYTLANTYHRSTIRYGHPTEKSRERHLRDSERKYHNNYVVQGSHEDQIVKDIR